mmetsp:Transcript_69563/g.203574  ORF Transcript_69563/g.203574 Transcript_69563/m.203574 type:complete len:202 (-) Transcript_69563:159-764(-)
MAARGRLSWRRACARRQYSNALAQPRAIAAVSLSRASGTSPSSCASTACCLSSACLAWSSSPRQSTRAGDIGGKGGSSAAAPSSGASSAARDAWAARGMASTLSLSAMLIQPSFGPKPFSFWKCRRSPTSSTSATTAPVARRWGEIPSRGSRTCGEFRSRPSRTTTPPLSAPPTTSHFLRAASFASASSSFNFDATARDSS